MDKPFCMMVHFNAPHRNWMPDTKHLGSFENIDIPIPPSFYDDYENRKAAEEADMRIDDMYLSFDLKLHKEYYGEETGTGGNVEYAKNIEQNWLRTYNRLTGEQKEKWDKYYDEVNREFKETNFTGKELLEWKYQRYMKDYLSCILSVDENIGRLMNYLDESGLTENTLVIYTSDQGFYLGEHGWYDKRFMYEESMSMPLLMRLPGVIPPGEVITEMVLNLDFAPTILELAKVEIPPDMQGESFVKLFEDNHAGWRNSVYYHYYEYPHGWHNVRKHYGIRTERYKLIKFYGDEEFWELYDLKNDPNELNNIFSNLENSALVERLKKELSNLQTKYKDVNPEKE
jgi:arylsulfatase A-like enzyme